MKKYYFFFTEGSKINQIICGILINMPVFAYGASIGWMSPMTLLLQSETSPRQPPLTDSEVSWMAAVAYLVCVPGDYLAAYLSDRIGRKVTLMFISGTNVFCWILKLSSMETWAFILARSLVGITMAGAYVTCPLYTKDIAEDSIRGALGSWVILFHTGGNLFAYIIGDFVSYRTMLWICMSIPTFHLILAMVLPESPSYLIKRGKLEEASRVLAWLRCRSESDSVVQHELDLIKKEQKNDEESSKFVFKAIFTDKILSRAFRIAIIVALAREVCGAVPVLNFAGDIFSMVSKDSGLVLSPNQQAMLLGAVQFLGSAIGSSFIERSGRKPLLFATSLVAGLGMCGLASWFLATTYNINAPLWLPVTILCLCIFCDSSGLQPVSVVITGEIFSFKYRGSVMASAMALASAASFIQMALFKPIANSVGIHATFYFFGLVCIATAVYVILVVPETKMRNLEEIYHDLKTKKEKQEELRCLDAEKTVGENNVC